MLLGVIEISEAKRIRAALAKQGVELLMVSNPGTCSSGSCGASVELRAAPADIAAFQSFMHTERERSLEGLNVDASRLDSVFDPSLAEATCPACGTCFATTSSECPDCGLIFQVGEE